MSALRASSFARRLVAQQPFNKKFGEWRRLVHPHVVPASDLALFQNWETQISGFISKTGDAKSVEPIDWATWSARIKTPGVVAELKKEYESQKFADTKADFLDDFNKQADALIQASKSKAEFFSYQILPQREKLELRKWERDNYGDLAMEDWLALYPGVEEQYEDMWWDGDLGGENWLERRVMDQYGEPGELRRKLKQDGPDAIPYPLPIDEITHMGDADWETQRQFLAKKQKEWDVGTIKA